MKYIIKSVRVAAVIIACTIVMSSQTAYVVSAKNNKWPEGPAKSSITAESAIVMEINTGTVLYNKNMNDKHYPASITKIMTTLLCLENAQLNDIVTFSDNAVYSIEPGSSHISIVPGEQLTMEDCLYGIMLMSANEACNGVAEHVAGSIDAFVDMMNARAKEIGCKNTHFANPNGLYMDDHYTTAYDMALIACEAMKNSMFRKITGTKTYKIPKSNKIDERSLYNKHNMLYPIMYPKYGYEYCIGGKTGYTIVARWTLVTFIKKDDLELACVVMKTAGPPNRVEPNEYTDTIKLANYAIENYEKYSLKVDMSSGDDEGQYSLFTKYNRIFDADSSPLYVDENAGVVLPKGVDVSEAEKKIEYFNDAEIVDGVNNIGRITYTYGGKVAGIADIMYDTSRLDDVSLNQNVSDIVSSAEANKQNEEQAEADNESSDEDKDSKDTPDKTNNKSVFKNPAVIIAIIVLILAIVSYITYMAIARARIRKHYMAGRSFRRSRKHSLKMTEKRRRKHMKRMLRR